ncbi:MAG: hypothetical protein KGZ45_05700 [Clostridium sp.]|nr:hypothetical protein [Clostridium sp.]
MSDRSEINFNGIKAKIEDVCLTESECEQCSKIKCLLGFAKVGIRYALEKNTYNIPQGEKLVPLSDAKLYSQHEVVEALAETLLQCKNCRDNHEEDCVINITRLCLEAILTGEPMPYHGNILIHLVDLSKINPEAGVQVTALYRQKNIPKNNTA